MTWQLTNVGLYPKLIFVTGHNSRIQNKLAFFQKVEEKLSLTTPY
jgi:hypothetical protein